MKQISLKIAEAKHNASDMHRRTSTHQVRAFVVAYQMLLDTALFWPAFALAFLVHPSQFSITQDLSTVASTALIFLIMACYERTYAAEALDSYVTSTYRLGKALVATLIIELLLLYASDGQIMMNSTTSLQGTLAALPILIIARLPTVWVVRHMIKDKFMRRILISDGGTISSLSSSLTIDAATHGLSPDPNDPMMLHRFSCLIHGADHIYVDCPPERRSLWSVYLKGIPCDADILMPEMGSILHGEDWEQVKTASIRVATGPLDIGKRLRKRLFDLVLTVPTLVVLTPVLAAIALVIKLDSPGPVLFRQPRMGRGNRLFYVYKFRSMRVEGSDLAGTRSTARDDDRITRVGRILRATSIDELPQLFNVLEGDMSLVGPRPHALGSLAGDQLFWHVDDRYWFRHAIKPGITGLAQVRGFRGATDHRHDLANRLQSDLEYVANWSLASDLFILLRTAAVLIHNKAY